MEPLNADRTVLRDVLMRGLERYVEFGKDFVGFETTAKGVKVRFANDIEVEGALLVGADGAWSRVRKQLLPELDIVDTEGRFMYGRTAITPQLPETFDKRAFDGMTGIHDRRLKLSMILFLEPVRFKDNGFRKDLPDDYICWVLLARKYRFEIDDEMLQRLSSDETAALSRKCKSDWHPSLQALFEFQEVAKTSMMRIISVRPDIAKWHSSRHVTLIGDAVRVMSPIAGAGAITAIRDAATLSQALSGHRSLVDNVVEYESEMRAYAQDVVIRSAVGAKYLFAMRPFEELQAVLM